MESVNQLATKHIQQFKEGMNGVDRVARMVDYAEKNPKLVAKIYLGYYKIIKDMIAIDESGLRTIADVNAQLEKNNAVHEFQEIVAGREKEVVALAADACDPESPNYMGGVKQLTEMMRNADTIKTNDPSAKPVDGDPKWDSVIWGYTNGAIDPKTDIHFVVAHGLTRLISQGFKDELSDLPGAEQKDWLLNAMTDMVALNGVQGRGREAEFYKQWRDKRPEGLGWVSDETDQAYKEALGVNP